MSSIQYDPSQTAIFAIWWPNRAVGVPWLVEKRPTGYSPIRQYGKSHNARVECTLAGRTLAKERGLAFVSDLGINTEDVET